MENYDSAEKSKYLAYIDANNLYGWAMSQLLPESDFRWLSEHELKSFQALKIDVDSDYGYILEVDLEYPHELHDYHNDLPFCPENKIAPGDKCTKLITTLENKTNYIIHGAAFKQCIENGLKCTAIKRVLTFKQSAWLKKYIDINTQKRQLAKNNFEKDFFKLMNNSVYGKTMENVEKRVNVKILNHWNSIGKKRGAEACIALPNFRSCSIFSDNLVAIELNHTQIKYFKPIYIGFSVLELSKTLMYDFHYRYMKSKFNQKIKLLYTDTDSFIYEIETDDFYKDIANDIATWFDTSDYGSDNIYNIPLLNKKVLGKMKDENAGKILTEFVGLRSKMYALDVEGCFTFKSKGINRVVVDQFSFHNYTDCLNNKTQLISKMSRFRSIKHVLFTHTLNKVALDGSDSKRFLIENSHDTLAWGHKNIY